MFHTSGGRVGGRRFPICLPGDALRIGARDRLLGKVEGAPVYEMEDRDGAPLCRSSAYVLDVAPGMSFGFSIEAAPGKRFTLKEVGSSACVSGAEKCFDIMKARDRSSNSALLDLQHLV